MVNCNVEIGNYITFEKDNDLPCFQDFSFFRGAPVGVEFEIVQGTNKDGWYWLRAFGYGIIGGGEGSYGNGRICVKIEEFDDKIRYVDLGD